MVNIKSASKETGQLLKQFSLKIFAAALAIFFGTIGLTSVTISHDYQHPDQDEWYAKLMMPDQPTTRCCGEKDAYWADKVDECHSDDIVSTPFKDIVYPCFLVAIITDDREIIGRFRFPVGTRIAIPKHKIRKHPSENPTDHNILFVGYNRFVFCWEPTALL